MIGILPPMGSTRIAAKEQPPALSPLPPAPALDPAKVQLGRSLFHDPMLSSRQGFACSSCHDLDRGGTINVKRSVGYEGRMHEFNVPTLFNVGNNYRLGWRGKFTSLAAKTEQVLVDRNLMANDWPKLLPRLWASPPYRGRFEATYGRPADRDAVLDALVTFQRSLVTPNAAFDRFLAGEDSAISPEQKRGYELFKTYGCVSCHQGSNVGGNMFQIFGVFHGPDAGGQASDATAPSETGHASLSDIANERNVYRVPSLRNVAATSPYFHDGRTQSLSDAVAVMARSQLGRTLSEDEIAAIATFLESLTGEYDGKPIMVSPVEGRR
ncbi:cytochrome-c peroxidase [Bosea caraganae]|nr:cytochrome c peroxidase [Bosea caraganae]